MEQKKRRMRRIGLACLLAGVLLTLGAAAFIMYMLKQPEKVAAIPVEIALLVYQTWPILTLLCFIAGIMLLVMNRKNKNNKK